MPKKNQALVINVGLQSNADPSIHIVAPTLQAADFNISQDGAAFTALEDIPTVDPAGSDNIKITLTAAEMNADTVVVNCKDNAGAAWASLKLTMNTDTGDIDDVLADTNELQTDDVPGLIAALDAVVDTVKAETALIVADTAELQTDDVPGLIAALDTVVDTHDTDVKLRLLSAAATVKLEASASTIVKATVDTVTNTHTPTTTIFQSDTITEATADHYIGRIVIFTTGDLIYQATDITDYVAVGGIGQFTVTALTEAPANNDEFVIV